MKRRVKIGDVEVGMMPDPHPGKNQYVVTRFRPRTREYLSTQYAPDLGEAEYLFAEVVGKERSRQAGLAERASAALESWLEPGGKQAGCSFYEENPDYARF